MAAPRIDLEGGFGEEPLPARRVQGVEEGAALDGGVEDLALLLQEIATAASLTEGAPHAEAREVPVADAGTGTTLTGKVGDDFFHGSQQLLEEQRVMSSVTGAERGGGHRYRR